MNLRVKPNRLWPACAALFVFLFAAGPLSAKYFINQLNHEVMLYSTSGRVIVLEPNQCAKTWSGQLYTIVYYADTSREAETEKETSRYDNARASCHSIAGGKLQCTRYLNVRYRKTGAIWLEGDKVKTGILPDFSPEQCFGETAEI